MKIILVGYPGSQHIVPASKYLIDKYLPDFEVTFLNYTGPKEGWSAYLADYLKNLGDKLVILALDDYLISGPLDQEMYQQALGKMEYLQCSKLCPNTEEELRDYPICTQYCIWNREFLIKMLSQTRDPWDFEVTGSKIFRTKYFGAVGLYPCIPYDVHSCLSSRWPGIKWDGVKQEDIDYIKNNNLINDNT